MKRNILKLTIFTIALCNLLFFSCQEKEKPDDNPPLPTISVPGGAYSATGTPLAVSTPAPSQWSGEVAINDISGNPHIGISNWADKSLIFLDFKNGKMYLDLKSAIELNGRYLCLCVGYYADGQFHASPTSFEYEVKYVRNTKTLDFSGKVGNNDAFIGLVTRNKTTGETDIFYGDTFYSDAKLVITPASGSSISINANSLIDEYFLKPAIKIESQSHEFQKIDIENVRFFHELIN